jgi:hypothetical protein
MTSTNTTTDRRRVRPFRSMGLTLLAATFLAACGDSLGVDGPQNVSLSFRIVETGSLAAAPASTGPVASAPARAVTLVGTNGTLVLDELYMIVTEIELEHEDGCDDDDGFNGQNFDDCEDFESGPHFVSLPLDGTPIVVATALVAPGVYDELEFEVEDLDDDDDDKRGRLADLRSQIVATVPDWPQKASIYVTGTFQAEGEDAVPFRTFIEGEIEVELDLIPNLVIGNDGSANRDLIVDMRPDLWFRDFQGWVLDLREWDYDTTGRLLELEIEIENGFIEVEVDD